MLILPLAMMLALAACQIGPRPINYGHDECAHCRMTVSEPAFGSQLVTNKGRHYNFDSIECLAAYAETGDVAGDDIHSMWVPDFTNPEEWVEAREAAYLKSPQLRSPMGVNLTAYAHRSNAVSFRAEHEGELLDWMDVRANVREEWNLGQ